MAVKKVIRWVTRDQNAILAIRKRFNIPDYVTVNGYSPAEIKESDMEVFEECARRGFFSVIPLKWCKNGETFAFISC